jgi:hypothetical protein
MSEFVVAKDFSTPLNGFRAGQIITEADILEGMAIADYVRLGLLAPATAGVDPGKTDSAPAKKSSVVEDEERA